MTDSSLDGAVVWAPLGYFWLGVLERVRVGSRISSQLTCTTLAELYSPS